MFRGKVSRGNLMQPYLFPACVLACLSTTLAIAGCGTAPAVRADAAGARPAQGAGTAVELLKVPDGGYQVQAATDSRGSVHVVYLTGEPGASDLLYARREGGAWTKPVRVGEPGGAVGAGTIRGPQIALGRSGRVHVVWFGSEKSGVKGNAGAPLLYTRLDDTGAAFEPARNLMRVSMVLDGGPGVAADGEGNVYVGWQAAAVKDSGEEDRRLWIARSTDDGKSFGAEVPAWKEAGSPESGWGACPCCSTEVFADRKGQVYAMYRIAASKSERDMALALSTDRGRSFRGSRIDPWPVPT
jgi:hypothetical protein